MDVCLASSSAIPRGRRIILSYNTLSNNHAGAGDRVSSRKVIQTRVVPGVAARSATTRGPSVDRQAEESSVHNDSGQPGTWSKAGSTSTASLPSDCCAMALTVSGLTVVRGKGVCFIQRPGEKPNDRRCGTSTLSAHIW